MKASQSWEAPLKNKKKGLLLFGLLDKRIQTPHCSKEILEVYYLATASSVPILFDFDLGLSLQFGSAPFKTGSVFTCLF